MIANVMIKINNLTGAAKDKDYIVARCVEGEYWYYGAYNDVVKAYAVAEEIGGEVFENMGGVL